MKHSPNIIKHFIQIASIVTMLILSLSGVAQAGGNGFSVALSANARFAFTGQYVTITATTNADVGPTPYYISVYDQTDQTEIAICGNGTTCSAIITQPITTTHIYQAYVGDYPPMHSPPRFTLTTSSSLNVAWYRPIIFPPRQWQQL